MNPLSQETDLTLGIKATSYFYSEHTNMLFPASAFTRDPFREDGSDLAICLHGIPNSDKFIDLLSSIEYYLPDFKGPIVVTTDNNHKDQKNKVYEYLPTSTVSVRIIELEEQLPNFEGRNYIANKLDSNWILFIEPGMLFLKNPLPAIKRAIEYLGVSFVNLPLVGNDNRTVSSLGGALLTDTDQQGRHLGGGSCFDFKPGFEFTDINIEKPFLSDHLFSNSCVVNRKRFLEEGGFTNCSTPGFEDVALSVRLYKKSIKIGNINEFVLVNHNNLAEDRPSLNGSVSLNVTNNELFEKLKVADGEANKKFDDFLYSGNLQNRLYKRKARKRIALIVDIKEWAFHNIAKNVETHLSEKYNFTIYFQADFMGEKWLDLFVILFQEKYDMIMCFWRPIYKHLFSQENSDYLKNKFDIQPETFEQFLNETILLTGVYDHLFLNPKDIIDHQDIFSNHVDGYFVSSHKLKGTYDSIDSYNKPHSVIQDGVDIEKFYRLPGATFSDPSAPLVVGWAGNSKWGMATDGIDHKGFETIIKPAVSELLAEGYSIKLIYADRHEPETHVPRSEMNNFYNSLDLYICASDIEGTPNPVLESMACGIGVISTDVGIVKEVLGKEQHKFILEERTKDCLKNKLITLINDRSILKMLAKENNIRINTWTWKSKCEKFERFFDYYLYKKSSNSLCRKKFPYSTTVIEPEEPNSANAEALISEIDSATLHLEELNYWKQTFTDTKNWYYKEYEVLPLWFKRLGHIVKVFQGRRSFKSLFSGK
jgi:O-antigen biosynthesis protein